MEINETWGFIPASYMARIRNALEELSNNEETRRKALLERLQRVCEGQQGRLNAKVRQELIDLGLFTEGPEGTFRPKNKIVSSIILMTT